MAMIRDPKMYDEWTREQIIDEMDILRRVLEEKSPCPIHGSDCHNKFCNTCEHVWEFVGNTTICDPMISHYACWRCRTFRDVKHDDDRDPKPKGERTSYYVKWQGLWSWSR